MNLLPDIGQKKRFDGDSTEMLKARQAFLDRGLFRPLTEAVSEMAFRRLAHLKKPDSAGQPLIVAETGCGNGHFLGEIQARLTQVGFHEISFYGMDISRDAVRMAARRCKRIFFFVADVKRRILFENRSISILLNCFSPRNAAEFFRVLAPDGTLIIVIPNPEHLAVVRKKFNLLTIQEKKREFILRQCQGLLTLNQEIQLEFELILTGEEMSALIRMSPNFWHSNAETINKIAKTDLSSAQASFRLFEFIKQA